ncbi:uncharacterized protein LOC125036153 isoform X2 [Penaeus chinensis]|uniref:uncharacterized protein LOC125036153 isoform X2 n=1 Tax=Penaeus chinensis TaxID=139456 RepID=UPI001FB8054A|nr:uncharacterized protein LOC125036153 isoform X2 [Penaeus chinensis]
MIIKVERKIMRESLLDLGDAKENWLQHLQEQALLKKRAQKEQKGHGGSPGMPAGDYFESGLREGSSGRASTRNSKCSTPRTPEKLIKSPFSALLDSSFITPTLVLSHSKDDGTPETSRVSPPFNPYALGLDLFSPLVSKTNTSVKLAASLGANLDDSLSSWTSALATPLTTDASGQTPTTLERLTLHPKQGLRQKVMVRSLFSPRTPGTSTHTDGSPNLGIIKCYSPIPTFNNRAVLNQQKQMPENNFFPLVDDTQSFRVYDKGNNSEEGKQMQIDGTNQLKGSVLAQNTINSDKDSGLEQKTKGPGQILHHGTDFSLPSSPEESLECHKLGNNLKPGKGTQLCKNPSIISISPTSAEVRKVRESGQNLQRNHIGTSNSGEGSIMQDRFQGCSEENQSKSPFDLICSPIKGRSTGENNMHDARELESLTEDRESLCNKRIEEESYVEQMNYECTVYEKETLSVACETTMPEKNICDHSTLVEEKTSPMTKEPPKTLSVPLFKKENKVMKELYKKDEGPVIEGYTSTPDSKAVLKKLSIHKNKRHSGKFLYPRKSEAGYEKLNMKYQECLDDAQSTVVETDMADITTEHVPQESRVAKIPKDIHDIANRQQNFVSLATLEKDDRLGIEKALKTSETKCRAQMEKGSQEEPVKQDSEKAKIVSGKLPEETAISPSREEGKAIDFAKVNRTSKDERSEATQPKSDDLQTDIGLQVVPQRI